MGVHVGRVLDQGGSIPLTEIVLTRPPLWPERSAAACRQGEGYGRRVFHRRATSPQFLRETIEAGPLSPHTNTVSRQFRVARRPTRFLGEDGVIGRTEPNRTLFTREYRSGRRKQTRNPACRTAAATGPAVP